MRNVRIQGEYFYKLLGSAIRGVCFGAFACGAPYAYGWLFDWVYGCCFVI